MSAALSTTRTLHLVDIENLAGGPYASGDEAVEVFERYLDASAWEPGDLVYVAANPGLMEKIAWRLPVECNLRAARGQDGADLALLAHAAPEFVARRFSRLVIGSGDHIFIERAVRARALGVGVVVVALASSVHGGWRVHGFPVLDVADQRMPVAA